MNYQIKYLKDNLIMLAFYNFLDEKSFCYTTATARKVSKYGVIFGSYFSVFGLNTGKYGPELTPYFDTFHALCSLWQLFFFPYIPYTSSMDKMIGPFDIF